MTVDALLKQRYPAELVDELLRAYKEIEENYSLSKWKASELDAGHFVEAARRITEWELKGGQYTPIGQQLPNFNDVALKQYEHKVMSPSASSSRAFCTASTAFETSVVSVTSAKCHPTGWIPRSFWATPSGCSPS